MTIPRAPCSFAKHSKLSADGAVLCRKKFLLLESAAPIRDICSVSIAKRPRWFRCGDHYFRKRWPHARVPMYLSDVLALFVFSSEREPREGRAYPVLAWRD